MKNGRLVGAAETCRDQPRLAEWRRLQRKNFSILGVQKGKGNLSATKRAVGKYARAAFTNRKRNRGICPDHQIVKWERVTVSESRTVARKRRIRAGAWRGNAGLHSKGR